MRNAIMGIALLAVALGFDPSHAQSKDAHQDSGQRNPKALPEIEQLDFLIGKWQLNTRFKSPTGEILREAVAELRAWYILDGHGFQMEERHNPIKKTFPEVKNVFVSTTIFNYDNDNKKWSGCSVNTLGNRKFLDGNLENGELVLIQDGKLFRGRKGKNRFTYSHITKDSFEFRLDQYDVRRDKWVNGTYEYTANRVR